MGLFDLFSPPTKESLNVEIEKTKGKIEVLKVKIQRAKESVKAARRAGSDPQGHIASIFSYQNELSSQQEKLAKLKAKKAGLK